MNQRARIVAAPWLQGGQTIHKGVRDGVSLDNARILITGGAGSFGRRFVKRMLEGCKPQKLVGLSRDEMKQFEMRQQYPVTEYPNLRFIIGDVGDRDRLYRALDSIDIVVHVAALK